MLLPEQDRVRLRHMLDAAREAQGYLEGKTREDLDRETMLYRALGNCIEIVGEAAAHVSVGTRASPPAIPWAQIVGMRNRLVHA